MVKRRTATDTEALENQELFLLKHLVMWTWVIVKIRAIQEEKRDNQKYYGEWLLETRIKYQSHKNDAQIGN